MLSPVPFTNQKCTFQMSFFHLKGPTHYLFNIKNVTSDGCILEQCKWRCQNIGTLYKNTENSTLWLGGKGHCNWCEGGKKLWGFLMHAVIFCMRVHHTLCLNGAGSWDIESFIDLNICFDRQSETIDKAHSREQRFHHFHVVWSYKDDFENGWPSAIWPNCFWTLCGRITEIVVAFTSFVQNFLPCQRSQQNYYWNRS